MTIDRFMDGLTVTYSDKITATSTTGWGWFLVTVEYPIFLPPLPLPPAAPPPSPPPIPPYVQPATIFTQRVLHKNILFRNQNREAFFEPSPDFKPTFLDVINQGNVPGDQILCRVVVKCGYLTDTQGRPVDGDFLKSSLPSGDGVPGGDFESWFVLTPQ